MSIDPVLLFFLFGLIAGLAKADLRLPPAIYDFLILLLLLTIGLKGGIELAQQSFSALAPQMLVVVAMGFLLTLLAFQVLSRVGRLSRPDAASVAAYYGSVSVGTYAVAVAYLGAQQVAYESYMPLFVVLLELPAIILGIVLARKDAPLRQWKSLAHEVLFGKGPALLLGGLLIGWAAGAKGVAPIEGMFFNLFKGALALFLMEMGLVTAQQFPRLRQSGLFIVVFAVLFPLLAGGIGAGVGWMLDLSVGGITMLATLAASASYIAAPAAMRAAVPQANHTLALAAALGVTFPLNVTVGIPLYHAFAKALTP